MSIFDKFPGCDKCGSPKSVLHLRRDTQWAINDYEWLDEEVVERLQYYVRLINTTRVPDSYRPPEVIAYCKLKDTSEYYFCHKCEGLP